MRFKSLLEKYNKYYNTREIFSKLGGYNVTFKRLFKDNTRIRDMIDMIFSLYDRIRICDLNIS